MMLFKDPRVPASWGKGVKATIARKSSLSIDQIVTICPCISLLLSFPKLLLCFPISLLIQDTCYSVVSS
jgi:hypothetical protein